MAGTRLRIVTVDGKEAGVGEEGEVRAKGPQVTLGYLDAALDAAALDEDGWFRTGDLGKLDAEGNLTITGRLKDVIIRKGENISAKEVEDLLFTHPKVADVAVIGLPDAESGERACAVVGAPPGEEPIGFDEMTAHLLAAGLITRKLPEQLELVDALPRNPSGKILKFELQARFQRRFVCNEVAKRVGRCSAAAAVARARPGLCRTRRRVAGGARGGAASVRLSPAMPARAPARWPLISSRWQAPSPSQAWAQPAGSTFARPGWRPLQPIARPWSNTGGAPGVEADSMSISTARARSPVESLTPAPAARAADRRGCRGPTRGEVVAEDRNVDGADDRVVVGPRVVGARGRQDQQGIGAVADGALGQRHRLAGRGAPVPASTGTRPPTASRTAASRALRSSASRVAASPVEPATTTPRTPASTSWAAWSAVAGASSRRPGRTA